MPTKSFSGAPFGFQSHRFDLAGVYPKRKRPGTIIGLQTSNNNIGPGYYLFEDATSSFSQTQLSLQTKKPGWKRSYDLEQLSAMPYILNKDLYLLKHEQKRKLGPGYYSTNNSSLNCNKYVKGMMSGTEPRFPEENKEILPGPGLYGKNGIPHLLKEEADSLRKSPSMIGFLSSGDNRERTLFATGCRLAPNAYSVPSFTDELINRHVGKRGPYEIFSLNRSKPIKTGHWAINPSHDLAPSHYKLKSSIDTLNDKHHVNHGKFLKVEQYPLKPHDRAFWDKPVNVPPDPNNQVAPGIYDIKFSNNNVVLQNSAPPFNSSSKRNDKLSNMFFTKNFNQVGIGRYDLHRVLDSQYVNSHESVFQSKSDAQLSKEKSEILKERLQAINIPVHRKTFIDHIPTEMSPCTNVSSLHNQYQQPLKIA